MNLLHIHDAKIIGPLLGRLFQLGGLFLLGALFLLGGCQNQDQPLQLDDLTAGERLYFERVVAVDRANSVALIHRDRGGALLDSLATAWGDSVLPEILDRLTGDPYRNAAISELLLRVVIAEQDSLKWDPAYNRLHLPLPDPNLPGRQRVPDPAIDPDI